MVAGWSERQCPSLTHLPFIYSLHAVIAQNRWVQLSLGRHRTALLTVTLTSNPLPSFILFTYFSICLFISH